MKLLYFLLFNLSIILASQDAENTLTLNNIYHDIKMLIAKKLDINLIPILKQLTPELNRFVEANLKKEYLSVKKKNENKIFSILSEKSDLDNINKVVMLLKKINRLFDDNILCENPSKFIKSISSLRYSPKFLYLGGKTDLEKLCQNYKINKSNSYEGVTYTLFISSAYDHYLLPINLTFKLIVIIPAIVLFALECFLTINYSNHPIFTTEILPRYYSRCFDNLTQSIDNDCFINTRLKSLSKSLVEYSIFIIGILFITETIFIKCKPKSKAKLSIKKRIR